MVSQFRPISSCNIIYNVVNKVVVNILKACIQKKPSLLTKQDFFQGETCMRTSPLPRR